MKRMVKFELGADEALLLFEMLANFSDQKTLEIRDQGERLALLRVSGAVERTMVEVFSPDYKQLIKEARSRLMTEFGTAIE